MPFQEFAAMMRRIKLVSAGDHMEFAEQVIEKVAVAGGVYAPELKDSASAVSTSIAGMMIDEADRIVGWKKGPDSGFKFGAASEKELTGVKSELVLCVRRALELSTQDFTVFDGIRTHKEQLAHVRSGASRTMKSKHLDGLAVDLVPWHQGKPVWDWNRIYPIAFAMDQAATELGFADRITWGGAWDRRLSDFGGELEAYKRECELYASRHPGKDFLDGPHFEWRS